MPEEISRLLENGQETIVRDWTEKVTADRRINSDARLSYVQLIDHVPQIVEELRRALRDADAAPRTLEEGKEHGRQRWRQGYELKEVVRELALLRATLVEFLEKYRAALPSQKPEQFTRCYHRINGFMDEEIYKTVEAYLDAPRHHVAGGETFPASSHN
ncbi:MAG TPA: RsbRD N-terminal domain-containing protein [Pyrinomonadaceae bacterium]|nr:RsbRD N-terminal domain-containing protein [Pyrinomonadaceae bacterium]